MARNSSKTKTIDTLENVAGADVIAGYQVANKEEDPTTSYYGYIDTNGNWYIQRVTATDVDFVKGTSSSVYATNWTNRASQSYAKFNAVF